MTPPTVPAPRVAVEGATAARRRRTGWVVLLTAMITVSAWCGWLLYSDLRAVIGPRAFTYAVLFAFAPVVPLVAVLVWLDRLRPEPRRLLGVAFVWGTLIATYVALRLNGWLATELGDPYGGSPRSAVFVAPWVEEACKATVIFAIAWWRRHDFNGLIAGAVYGGLTGVGFAFTENIVYYGQIFQHVRDLGSDNGAAVHAVSGLFVWRGVAAPFIHPMFTMMTGLGIGLAVRYRHVGVRLLAPAVGYCTAVVLHMAYNTAASFTAGRALVAVYVGLLVPALVVLAAVIGWVRRHERQVIAARLNDYTVYGWLRAEQIPYIVSRQGRRTLRRHVRTLGQPERDRARELQRTGMDLGVLRDRFVRGVAGERDRGREDVLIARLRDLLRRGLLPEADGGRRDLAPARSNW